VLAIVPALAAWAVIPFDAGMVLADINAGLLYMLALTSLGVYGIIIAGLGLELEVRPARRDALRRADRLLRDRHGLRAGRRADGGRQPQPRRDRAAQEGSVLHWFWLPLLPLFLIYFISGVAETNRAPFDVAEGESEIVAGFHVEYSGMAFAVFFLAEYANMILISALARCCSSAAGCRRSRALPVIAWTAPSWPRPVSTGSLLKTSLFLFLFLWFRATFPRYRYDQIMRLGWKVFIPITIVWLFVWA
jgi:NADH-quinone oxidoreductase subunit H